MEILNKAGHVVQFVVFKILIIGSVLFLFSCQKQNVISKKSSFKNSPQTAHVIYGEDGRLDMTQVSDPELKNLALSTLALIDSQHMVYDSVFNIFHFENPDSNLKMCASEKFLHQPRWAFCSGALIATDLILTAGHCVRSEKDCRKTKFVFDYALSEKQRNLDSIAAENVYECAEIVTRSEVKNGADFAVVRLDRRVQNRDVLKLEDFEQAITYQDQLMLIGHPAGLPTKIDRDGVVRNLLPEAYFVASLDALSGNSGSAVFNQKTNRIVGVLSRGEQDFELKNGCYVSKVCAENECRGEDVTRISEIRKFLPPN